MKEHFARIYADHAEDYDLLVRREDHQGNLPRTVRDHVAFDQASVVELGLGTGRLTSWIVECARTVHGFDSAPAMLEVARRRLVATSARNWSLSVADHCHLPLSDGVADVAIEGWAFGHLVEDGASNQPVEAALAEMRRVVRPGGTLAIIETLGTGRTVAAAPNERLAAFYAYLEQAEQFQRVVIRTDYRFESVAEAERLCGFFFGAELAERVRAEQLTVLAECTGLWVRTR